MSCKEWWRVPSRRLWRRNLCLILLLIFRHSCVKTRAAAAILWPWEQGMPCQPRALTSLNFGDNASSCPPPHLSYVRRMKSAPMSGCAVTWRGKLPHRIPPSSGKSRASPQMCLPVGEEWRCWDRLLGRSLMAVRRMLKTESHGGCSKTWIWAWPMVEIDTKLHIYKVYNWWCDVSISYVTTATN